MIKISWEHLQDALKKIKPRYRERGFMLTIPKPLTFST
jgi:hypothetical protein